MERISFGIVGAGWRAAFFLRVARELPERFSVSVVVETNPDRAAWINREWGIPVVTRIDEIAAEVRPDFLVLCLPQALLPQMIVRAAGMGFYVLTETFAAETVEMLASCYHQVQRPSLIQISEQYWYQPIHAARLALIREGTIGTVTQAQVSVGHGYHGVSLLRKYLGIGYENCRITGKRFYAPVVKGPGRAGDPLREELVTEEQQLALFEFEGKWGMFDFTEEQYFSGIRRPRLLVRGERGEICDLEVRHLLDYRTPVSYELRRVASGEHGSMGAPHITGITAADRWLYRNPFGEARLSDDEIAVATVLERMGSYVRGGESFYSFEEGCQDQYLALMLKRAMDTGKSVQTETQPWALRRRNHAD